MQKFYLKINKEKWTAKGGPGEKKESYHEEGNRGCCLLDPLQDVQMKKKTWMGIWTYIPEGLGKEDGPPETGILTAQRTDEMETWRATDGLREGTRRGRRRRRRRRRNMSTLCAASRLCEKRSSQTELNKARFLTPRAQPGFFFSLNRQHFAFSAHVHLFFCVQ